MKHIKIWVKVIIFLLGLAILVLGVQQIFGVSDYRIYQIVQGFYAEPYNSLDAVYIGASNVYSFWQAPIAWAEYGYTVYPWSVPNMPGSAIKYIIEDSLKTQPDALYIINLNDFKSTEVSVSSIHYLVDYMPMSTTKIKLIHDLAQRSGITGFDQMEFFLPIIRFHSGWSELTSTSFSHPLNNLKGAVSYKSFLNSCMDITSSYRETEQTVALTVQQNEILDDLFSYCEDNSVRVLFVVVPQAVTDETTLAQLNMVADIAESRGFDVLNLERSTDEIGLDLTIDYYNEKHLNVHGSLKYTNYLSKYLSENYDFEDKRDNPSYTSWDDAYERYQEILAPYVLDFELSHAQRDNSMSKPVLLELKATGQSFTLTWEKMPEPDKYLIYRRYENHPWECIANVDGDTTSYKDERLTLYDKYWYTVVPVKTLDDEVFYGKFDISGISGTTTMNAPVLLSLDEAENGVTITWGPVDGAEGYAVYRKINGQSWNMIATVDSVLSYTDFYYQNGLPYVYSVAAYQTVYGERKYGYYNHTGLLLKRDLDAPELALEFDLENELHLTWGTIKGASSYSVYKREEQGDWQLIKSGLKETDYIDADIEQGITYFYQVTSVLKYGDEIYEYPSSTITTKMEGSES